MAIDEAQKFAIQLLAERDPELADRLMWLVQERRISDDDAFRIALDYAKHRISDAPE